MKLQSKWCYGLCAMVLMLSSMQVRAAGATPSAEAIVRDATDDMIKVLHDAQSYHQADEPRLHRAMETLLDPLVDYAGIARSVMASYYKEATAEQQQRFAEVFKHGLVRTYARAMIQFADDRIEVLPSEDNARPNRATVKMQVTTKEGQVYPLEYTMFQDAAGKWMVRNLVVNGINLGLTYRNQFAAEMESPKNERSIDKVIEGWSAAPTVNTSTKS